MRRLVSHYLSPSSRGAALAPCRRVPSVAATAACHARSAGPVTTLRPICYSRCVDAIWLSRRLISTSLLGQDMHYSTIGKDIAGSKTTNGARVPTLITRESHRETQNFNDRIYTHLKKGELRECFAIAAEMRDSKVVPNITTFNLMVRCCVKGDHVEIAEELVREMKAIDVKPDKTVYNSLLKIHAMRGDARRCVRIFNEMKTENVDIDSHGYSTMIRILSESRDLDSAFDLVQEMHRLEMHGHPIAYKAFLLMSLRMREPDYALDMVKIMEHRDVAVSSRTYCSLLEVGFRREHPTSSLHSLSRLEAMGVAALDEGSLLCTINVAARTGHVLLAETAWTWMERSGVPHGRSAHNALFQAYATGGAPGKAFVLMNRMIDQGIDLDSSMKSKLVAGLSRSTDLLDEAFFAMKDIQDVKGDKFNLFCFNALIAACAVRKELDRAFAVFAQLGHFALEADLSTYNSLLDACARSKRSDHAFDVLRELKRAGLEPNVWSYHHLIKACALSGDMAAAEKVFQEVRMLGIVPTADMYTSLIEAYVQQNNKDQALILCIDMRSHNKYFRVAERLAAKVMAIGSKAT